MLHAHPGAKCACLAVFRFVDNLPVLRIATAHQRSDSKLRHVRQYKQAAAGDQQREIQDDHWGLLLLVLLLVSALLLLLLLLTLSVLLLPPLLLVLLHGVGSVARRVLSTPSPGAGFLQIALSTALA